MSFIRRFFSDTLYSLKKCDVLFVCHDVDRGLILNGKAYSPLIDSVRDDFEDRGLHCASLQHPWSECYGLNGHSVPVSMNRSYLFARLKDKIQGWRFRTKTTRRLSVSTYNLYSAILNKVKPKCIVCIGASVELCRAANDNNILLVELLHGTGYTFIPWGYDTRSSEALPNIFLSLDPISIKTFSEFDKLGKVTLKIPHPFLKRFANPKFRAALPDAWAPQVERKSKKFKKVILLSLQWGYSDVDRGVVVQFENILNNGLFPDCIARLISNDDSVLWWFRLHPVQIRLKKYSRLVRYLDDFCKRHKNCEWKSSSSLPLPTLLANCDGHISMSSMSAYEAAYMGVPSLMLCPTLQSGGLYENFFLDLEAAQFVTKASINLETIRTWVETVRPKPPLECGLGDDAAWEHAVSLMLGEHKPVQQVTNI